MSGEARRRDLIREGMRIGGLALTAGALPAYVTADPARAQADGDAKILAEAARLELRAAYVFDVASRRGHLSAPMRTTAKKLAGQDTEHASRLVEALELLGGRRPPGPTSIAQVKGLAQALDGGQARTLDFAIGRVESIVAHYYRAQSDLRDAKLLQIVATIMCNQGEHLVILRQARGENPVPRAFETGAP